MSQSSSIPALHRWLSEPRENHACYQVAPSCYKLLPLTKVSKELRMWTVRSQDAGPRERRCTRKEWLQSAQALVSSHTQKSAKFLNLRYLAFVQSLSRVWLFATPWTAARPASLSITNSRSLLKLKSIESVMPCNHLILCHPLLLTPSIFPSIKVFPSESALRIRWPKYWSFSFGIQPFNEHSGFISFRMDWLDLLAFQGTLKSLLQHHSSKASILQPSVFFMRYLLFLN